MVRDKFMKQINQITTTKTFSQEPAWFTKIRNEEFSKLGDEKLPRIDKINYQNWPFINQPDPEVTEDENVTNEYQITPEMEAANVIVCSIEEALLKHENLLKPVIEKIAAEQSDRLTSLNLALVTHGTFVYVPKNITLKNTITIKTRENTVNNQDVFDRTIVFGDVNSNFNVVQNTSSVGNNQINSHLTANIIAKENSKIQFFGMDATASHTNNFINRKAIVGKHATMNWMIGALNNGNTAADFSTELIGDGSVSDSRIVAISNQKQQQGINTRITNYGLHSDAQIDQRGAILDKSKVVFNGIGKVQHGAHQANNQQQNHILMLSENASGDANPILLINENDVVAGHAASIGRINEKQLYYLMSRGIPEEIAQKLVIRGFLGIILDQIPSSEIKSEMINTIERKLEHERTNV